MRYLSGSSKRPRSSSRLWSPILCSLHRGYSQVSVAFEKMIKMIDDENKELHIYKLNQLKHLKALYSDAYFWTFRLRLHYSGAK